MIELSSSEVGSNDASPSDTTLLKNTAPEVHDLRYLTHDSK
jgi:hypothetical protein